MAPELTYDPTPIDAPEFNESELAALEVGENAEQSQQQLFAGKFRDAEELEKAYMELQGLLGKKKDEEPAPTEETEEIPEEPEVSPAVTLISEASKEYFENEGQLSPETLAKFSELSSADLVKAYMELQADQPQTPQQVVDLSEAEVNQIKGFVGGEEAYTSLVGWASENLPDATIESYDSLVDSGNPGAIQLALAGLKAMYDEANGYEGRLLTGRGTPVKDDGFRSQAEVVQAMNDPRYDRDPAYRADVFARLERSNLNY